MRTISPAMSAMRRSGLRPIGQSRELLEDVLAIRVFDHRMPAGNATISQPQTGSWIGAERELARRQHVKLSRARTLQHQQRSAAKMDPGRFQTLCLFSYHGARG
jgi:hypothetical protein